MEDPEHQIPYAKIVGAITFLVLACFSILTYSVIAGLGVGGVDDATRGSLIQTWNNMTIAVVSFWLGSSVGGRIKK